MSVSSSPNGPAGWARTAANGIFLFSGVSFSFWDNAVVVSSARLSIMLLVVICFVFIFFVLPKKNLIKNNFFGKN